jgi:hypothetical protein
LLDAQRLLQRSLFRRCNLRLHGLGESLRGTELPTLRNCRPP